MRSLVRVAAITLLLGQLLQGAAAASCAGNRRSAAHCHDEEQSAVAVMAATAHDAGTAGCDIMGACRSVPAGITIEAAPVLLVGAVQLVPAERPLQPPSFSRILLSPPPQA